MHSGYCEVNFYILFSILIKKQKFKKLPREFYNQITMAS